MNGLNHAAIIGHAGQTPEMRYTSNGKPVTSFSVAVNSTHRDATGQSVEETEWFNCVAWDKLAETVNSYVQKGALLYVAGRLKTRTWEQDGTKRTKTELVVNEVKFLDRRPAAAPETAPETAPDDDLDGLPF
ncbi:MAG: single-stranded DNA-binding protein [Chloroflexota bacterium]|nr:single-stranded DNA-binding protein [Chloroflexota bacterium]